MIVALLAKRHLDHVCIQTNDVVELSAGRCRLVFLDYFSNNQDIMIEKQQQNQARDVFCHVFASGTDDRSWRANVATPTQLCSRMRAATIRGRLLFLWRSSRCGYYSRAATSIRGAASIRISIRYVLLGVIMLCSRSFCYCN